MSHCTCRAATARSRGGTRGAVRSFFASSTDHTRLLADAQVHRLPARDNGPTQYVFVASGMDKDLVVKVPQLHLARLFVDQTVNTMFGAKVVNRTLGDPVDVCGKLVDAARQDGALQARCTLHGLSDYVLSSSSSSPSDAARDLAHGKNLHYDPQDEIGIQWEGLARDFVASHTCLEANLYLAKGAVLQEILHHHDESDFRDTCGGAMALFAFP